MGLLAEVRIEAYRRMSGRLGFGRWDLISSALSNSPWVGAACLVTFLLIRGTFKLVELRSRRKTYARILECAPPGTLLVDRTGRGRELVVVRAATNDDLEAATATVVRQPR